MPELMPLGRRFLVSLVAICVIASGLTVLPSKTSPASAASGPATPNATLISQSPTGEVANGASQPPVISADGRYVAFASFASNLVEGDTNEAPDVFLHDRSDGTTKRIFTNAYLRFPLEELIFEEWYPASSLVVPTISDDGRFVAALACPGESPINFDDVPPPGLCGINLYDTQTEQTKRIAAFEPGEFSWLPNLSGDGNFLTFVSCYMVESSEDQCGLRVYNTSTAETAPIGSLPKTLDWGVFPPTPSVSTDGQVILHWECIDENGIYAWDECDVLVTDRNTGTTQKVPREPGIVWIPVPIADGPSVSANGDLIVLTGVTDPDEGNSEASIYLYDRRTGSTRNISESLGVSGIDFSASATISPDGRYIAFWTASLEMYFRPRRVIYEISTGNVLTLTDPFGPTDLLDNLIYELDQVAPGVVQQLRDVRPLYSSEEINRLIDNQDPGLVRDLLIEIRDLVDATIESEPNFDEILDEAYRDGILLEFLPAAKLSYDGRWATFLTRLALVPADTNEAFDVYVVDRDDLAPKQRYIKRKPREYFGHRKSSGYASDPVNTASGNYTETNVDLEFGLSGLDHARTYNAMDNRVGPLGRGWSLNSSTSLNFVAGASIELTDADGRVVTFVPDGTGGYVRPEEMFGELVKLSDNSFELRYFNGETWVFDANGRLVSKNFWDGQSVAFSYGSSGQLVRVAHSTGIVVDYEYENQRLVRVVSSDGRTIAYSYDTAGNLASVTDAAGALTQYENDALGLVTKITDPNGHLVIENTYDEEGRVTHQLSGSGNSTTFVYDDETGITTVGDDATYTSVRYAHDEQGRLTSITDIYGAALTKSYDASGNLVGTLDRRGATTAQTFDAHGNQLTNTEVGGIAESFEYDTADRLISSTDALGNITRYSYEGNNRIPSAMTNAKGAVSTTKITNGLITAGTDADGVKTTYTYDAKRNLISITDALGNKSSFAYDDMGNQTSATTPSGHKTTTTFDKQRRITAVEEPTGAITRYEYSPKGDLTKITDPTGAISTYSYDNAGRLVGQTEPNGAITTYVYDSHDNLIETHGPNGAITKSSFDAMGRLLSSTDANGGVTRYEYDADGNTTKVIDPLGATSSRTLDDRGREIESIDAHGQITKSEYDVLDRVIASIDPTGARTQTVYDAIGNVTELIDALGAKSISRYSPASRVIETIDPKGNSTTYRYDPSGRQIGVIDPLGAHTKTSYDRNGNVASTISPTGLVTKFAYDASGRQIEVRNPRGGISTTSYSLRGEVVKETDPTGASKRYSYDAVGNLIAATDANGGVTKFSYDLVGNRTSITDQLGARSEFRFDLNGQMISKSDPLGRITTFAYDQRGMLVAIGDPSGRSETRSYDAIGQLMTRTFGDGSSVSFVYDQAGRRTKMTDSTGTTAYGYDAVGRLISRTYPDGSVVSSTFDLVGNRSSLTYPDATTATYSFDGANRLVGMEHPKVGKVTYTLDLEGRLISESLPTGAKTKDGKWSRSYGYTNDLMTTFTDTRGDKPKTTTFGYDQAGRVTSETSKNKTKRYSYDPAGQLTKVTGPDSGAGNDLSFTYDSVGNRTTMRKGNQATKYVYDPAKQLTSASTNGKTTSYSYDQAGRRIKEQRGNHSVTSAYDQTGAVSSITTANGNETIRKETRAYDGDGVLVRSTTEEQSDDDDGQMITESRFRWDTNTGVPEILTIDTGSTSADSTSADSTSADSTSTDLFYGYGRMAAFGKNKLTMFSKDAYGSTISFGDDDVFVRASSYDPWGNPSKGNEDDDDKSTGPKFGYRSELHLGDEDIYLRARNYDPTTGRFTTVDPLDGVVGELTVANPYHYVDNDPLNKVDPLGLRPATDKDLKRSGSKTQTPEAPMPEQKTVMVNGNAIPVPENWDNMTKRDKHIFVAWVMGPEAFNAVLNPKNDTGIFSIIKEMIAHPLASFKAGLSETPTWFWVVDGVIILASGGFIACFATGIAPCVVAGNTVLVGGSKAVDVGARTGGAIGNSGNVLTSSINLTTKAVNHILARHFPGGTATAGKSIFNAGESIRNLIEAARGIAPMAQANSNLVRVVNAGRTIGFDIVTGKPTSVYTVITTSAGDLVTMYPGRP